ncbi:MAG: thiamine pyrophosphate-dependent dehydrogenase E1 component subunit alpha [Firmicutes bacterium]|jgi:2-oxoisovalerate dehydrogenase E1 component alpha subunit|nr:thiamine pyrophosphate-dependent dehydrogenase E1 component subunit alpha [Bacillota bacterium]
MYRTMVLARALDERANILYRQGKIAFTVTGIGHEGAQVGAVWALRAGHDVAMPYYRDTAVVLALGMTPEEIMLGEFARAADPSSGGRQMPKHWGHKALNIPSGSSPVGTQIPHAAGLGLAVKLKGEDKVVWVSFGDGAVSRGDFHEGINFAAIHKLPVIFYCQNNRYAISVPFAKQSPVPNVATRALAYGIPGVTVDGADVFAVYGAMREAVERARRGEGPTLIEALTYRMDPHTTNDDDRKYRPREEVERARREQDPVRRLREYVLSHGLASSEELEQLEERARQEALEAARKAEAAPPPEGPTALRHVYAEEGSA